MLGELPNGYYNDILPRVRTYPMGAFCVVSAWWQFPGHSVFYEYANGSHVRTPVSVSFALYCCAAL